jgi:hypothetical protein
LTVSRPLGVLLSVLLLCVGCENTTSEIERGISPPAAGLTFTGALAGALLAAETAWVVDADALDELECPGAEMDSDDLRAEYADCVPDSGLTTDVLSGVLNLTVPVGTGLFDGTLSAFGSDESFATGSLTGSASRSGDLLSADVTLTDMAWADLRGETPVLNGFFDIDADADAITINVDGASWDRGETRDYTFWLEDVVVLRGELDNCVIPQSGSFRVQRDGVEANIEFSPEAAEEGVVSVTIIGQEESSSLRPCG